MSSKPLPILPHMPPHIKQKIVSSADTVTKLVLRRSSKEYKTFVDKTQLFHASIDLKLYVSFPMVAVVLEIDEDHRTHLLFSATEKGYSVENKQTKAIKEVEGVSFIDAAMAQFVKTFKIRNILLHTFCFHFGVSTQRWYQTSKRSILRKTGEALSSLNHKLPVIKFATQVDGNQDDVLQVLPYLEPGTLKVVYFKSCGEETVTVELDRVAELPQWKMAQRFGLENVDITLPVEMWSHFLSANIGFPELSEDSLRPIIQGLITLRTWEYFTIICEDMDSQFLSAFLLPYRINNPLSLVRKYQIPIPNSRDLIDIAIKDEWIYLTNVRFGV